MSARCRKAACVSMVFAMMLASGCAQTKAFSDRYGAAERSLASGDYLSAYQSYDQVVEASARPDEYARAQEGRCEAARGMARAALAKDPIDEAQHFEELLQIRDRLIRCGEVTPDYNRVVEAMQERALRLWDDGVQASRQSGEWGPALSQGATLVKEFPGTLEIWARYAALVDEYSNYFSKRSQAARGRPAVMSYYAMLLALANLEDRGGRALSAELEELRAASRIVVAIETVSSAEDSPAICHAMTQGLQQPRELPETGIGLRLEVDVQRCTEASRVIEATYLRHYFVERREERMEEVCETYTVPVTVQGPSREVCGGAKRCYQTSAGRQTCFQDCTTVSDTSTRYEQRRSCQIMPVVRTHRIPQVEELPGRQVLREVRLKGMLRVVDADARGAKTPLDRKIVMRGDIVQATQTPQAPGDSAMLQEFIGPSLMNFERDALAGYREAVLLPRLALEEKAAREATDAEALVDVALWMALSEDEVLRQQGRAILVEEGGLSHKLLDAGLDGRAIHPSPFVPHFWREPFDWSRVDITSDDAIAVTGTAFFQLISSLKGLYHEGFETQQPRSGVSFNLNYRVNLAAVFLQRHLGWIYQDQFDAGVSFGSRRSDPVTLIDEWSDNRREEFDFAYGYRLAYTALFGHRGMAQGAFVGVRAQQTGDRTGYMWTAGAALPVVLQLELRPNPFYPTVLQLWGGDLNPAQWDRTMGASIHIPGWQGQWWYLHLERQRLRTQFLGLRSEDFVDAGRRPSWEGHLGFSMSIF